MRHISPKIVVSFILIAAVITALSALPASGQTTVRASRQFTTAERVANEEVALSADKILEMLKSEPGLLLEFKKTLVRKAYEQGRYLDPQDLTDGAVFNLVNTDATIRVLATQEIESRGYIRALPRQQDVERARVRKIQGAPELPADKVKSQEQAYWATHEVVPPRKSREYGTPPAPATDNNGENGEPLQPQQPPEDELQQPGPERQVIPDRRRQIQRADSDQLDMLGASGLSMARISPDELPGLLGGGTGVVSAAERSRIGSGSVMGQSQTFGAPAFGAQPSPFSPDNYSALSNLNAYGAGSSGSSTYPSTMAGSYPQYVRRRIPQRVEPPLLRHRPNPYADVPSLYDLYTQVSKTPPTLRRFGSDIFLNGTSNFDELPMDLPAGPEYVLGPGDGLTINIWGGIAQRLQRTVDRGGRLALPEVGTIMVAGRTLGDVQREVESALRSQLRGAKVDVALSRLRSVRVYVVGDVQYPGPYDISSLSTPLNAVLAAGGPTQRGSFRTIQQFRGKQLVQQEDIYDLILHGVRSDVRPLESGDTILVPPIGPQVAIVGMVRRPAIYELNGATNLAEALELSGGVLNSGTLRHIDVERVQAHRGVTMLSLDLPETNDKQAILKSMEDFKVQDGDKIRISPILPYSEQTVYLDGHVFHPGKYPYHEGMKLTDLIHSYADLMPEPAENHAEIVRLNPPDFRPTVLAFNLGDALAGKGEVPALKPFDTVRIFGRYDFEDPPEIIVSGEVRSPGELLTNGQTRLRDAIYLAGGLTPDAKLDDVQIYRREAGRGMRVFSVNLANALRGDAVADIMLHPRDRVIVQRNLAKYDPPTVTITGEVARPGKYPLAENMTATDLVKLAGGFKRSAYTRSADLSRYLVENGSKVLGEHQEVPIGKAMAGVEDTDVRLMDGDVLSVRQLSGWSEVSASVAVRGEVVHPSVYGIHDGERLSSVLRRAGGFRPGAYPYGAVLERIQVQQFAEKNRQEMIRRIEGGENLKFKTEEAGLVQAALLQQQQVLTALRSQTASGRLVIHISSDIRRWANTANDIELRPGDTILIPKHPTFVLVTGQVYNGSAITFSPGKPANWYLQQAGGPTKLADGKNIFIVRADGSVVGHGNSSGSFWRGSVTSVRLRPGDTVVVPEKFIGTSVWKELLTAGQLASSLAIAARVATSF
jgi:protein involved in polysaccharide export with SLBB domain